MTQSLFSLRGFGEDVWETAHGIDTAPLQYVGVVLCGAQFAVAQQAGEGVDVYASGQLVDGKGMASGMKGHMLGDPGL